MFVCLLKQKYLFITENNTNVKNYRWIVYKYLIMEIH